MKLLAIQVASIAVLSVLSLTITFRVFFRLKKMPLLDIFDSDHFAPGAIKQKSAAKYFAKIATEIMIKMVYFFKLQKLRSLVSESHRATQLCSINLLTNIWKIFSPFKAVCVCQNTHSYKN